MNNFSSYSSKYKKLEQSAGYDFTSKRLLRLALTHSSYENENGSAPESNERLEFLGDAVVSLVSAEMLYKEFPDLDEGMLTKIRSSLVCTQSLSKYAKKISLQDYILLGKGEKNNFESGIHKARLLEDTFEAFVGAIYLDGGLNSARKFIRKMMASDLAGFDFDDINEKVFHDYKSLLQTKLQKQKFDLPKYNVIEEEGPVHDKTFKVDVVINGIEYATGIGKNKKSAEQDAAKNALAVLENEKK